MIILILKKGVPGGVSNFKDS